MSATASGRGTRQIDTWQKTTGCFITPASQRAWAAGQSEVAALHSCTVKPNNAEAIIVFLFYCPAVHAAQQERRKLR
jgi:hypothetical protein